MKRIWIDYDPTPSQLSGNSPLSDKVQSTTFAWSRFGKITIPGLRCFLLREPPQWDFRSTWTKFVYPQPLFIHWTDSLRRSPSTGLPIFPSFSSLRNRARLNQTNSVQLSYGSKGVRCGTSDKFFSDSLSVHLSLQGPRIKYGLPRTQGWDQYPQLTDIIIWLNNVLPLRNACLCRWD